MKNEEYPEWGSYACPKQLSIVEILKKIGLGRGKIKRWLVHYWQKRNGSKVDITVRGIHYRLNLSDNVIDRKIFASSIVPEKTELMSIFNACCQGGTFLDIGANIGYYTLNVAARTNCKVIAIEPNPVVLERLRFNVALNHFQEKIDILPIGVGAEKEEVDFFLCRDLGSASMIKNPDTDPKHIYKIKTKPLQDIVNNFVVGRVCAMKIDIEGMEDRALCPFFKSADRTLWPQLLVLEHCHQDLWKEDINGLLIDKGYSRIKRVRGNTMYSL